MAMHCCEDPDSMLLLTCLYVQPSNCYVPHKTISSPGWKKSWSSSLFSQDKCSSPHLSQWYDRVPAPLLFLVISYWPLTRWNIGIPELVAWFTINIFISGNCWWGLAGYCTFVILCIWCFRTVVCTWSSTGDIQYLWNIWSTYNIT